MTGLWSASDTRQQISLDGLWQIRFDPHNEGKQRGWSTQQLASSPGWADAEVTVPGCWEQLRPGYDGVAWYHRTFDIAPSFLDGHDKFVLRFSAVNYLAEVWLNSSFVGEHEGGYTPCEFDVSEFVTPGIHHLIVRVLDPPKDEIESVLSRHEASIDGIALKETPCWRELESFNFGGIWQSVRLIALSNLHVTSCFIEPLLESHAVRIHIELESRLIEHRDVQLRVALAPYASDGPLIGETVHSQTCAHGVTPITMVLSVSNAIAWTPDHPYLYECQVEVIADGVCVDRYRERFGYRSFTLQNGRFCLNGRPIFIKGGFHEGLYPRTIATPLSEDFAREEIRLAKAAGYNLLRVWQVPAHPMLLDAADELGMMICEEPPIEWIKDSPHLRRRCENEVRELVLRDRNRPSVVLWGILNESGHLPSFPCGGPALRTAGYTAEQRVEYWRSTQIQQIKGDLCRLARSFDPTRVIIDDSGGWVGGANIYLPYSDQAIGFEDLHIYRPAPTDRETEEFLRALPGDRGPVFVSEVGYGSLPNLDAVIEAYHRDADSLTDDRPGSASRCATEDLEDYRQYVHLRESLRQLLISKGLTKLFPSLASFAETTQEIQAEGNRRQLQALRCNPNCIGYVVHAYSAGGVILGAETVDIWRQPKRAPLEALRRLHLPLTLVIDRIPAVGYAGGHVNCRVTLVNEGENTGDGNSLLEVGIEPAIIRNNPAETSSDRPLMRNSCAELRRVVLERGVHVVFEGALQAPSERGEYVVTARLWSEGALLAEGTRALFTIDPTRPPSDRSVSVVDCGGVWSGHSAMPVVRYTDPAQVDDRILDPPTSVVLVLSTSAGWSNDHFQAWLPVLAAWVAKGGTAVFQGQIDQHDASLASHFLPISVRCRRATGNWNPCTHYAWREHPLFHGLPGPGPLGSPYAEVLPRYAFVDMEGKSAAGCISMEADIFRKPERFWCGDTFLEQTFGQGRILLSQFRLAEGAARGEALATRMLANLIRYASREA